MLEWFHYCARTCTETGKPEKIRDEKRERPRAINPNKVLCPYSFIVVFWQKSTGRTLGSAVMKCLCSKKKHYTLILIDASLVLLHYRSLTTQNNKLTCTSNFQCLADLLPKFLSDKAQDRLTWHFLGSHCDKWRIPSQLIYDWLPEKQTVMTPAFWKYIFRYFWLETLGGGAQTKVEHSEKRHWVQSLLSRLMHAVTCICHWKKALVLRKKSSIWTRD